MRHATNNFAEYSAVILALETLKKIVPDKNETVYVEMRMDSELVVRQLSGIYQIREESLFPLLSKYGISKLPSFLIFHLCIF